MTKNDLPKVINLDVNAREIKSIPIDLSGYSIKNHVNPGMNIDSINYEVSAQTVSSDGYVTVAATDNIVIDMNMDSVFVSFSNIVICCKTEGRSDLIELTRISQRQLTRL